MDEGLVDIQTRLAFQEDGLHGVQLTLARQQQLIDRLAREIHQLRRQIAHLTGVTDLAADDEPPPPHY